MTIRVALIALVALLLVAAPAQATLLVRSDGEGLTVLDKNGLNDSVLHPPTAPRLRVAERQPRTTSSSSTARPAASAQGRATGLYCDDDRPKINIGLFGGNDEFA